MKLINDPNHRKSGLLRLFIITKKKNFYIDFLKEPMLQLNSF